MSRSSFLRVDSPWLWAGLFAVVGFCGVLIIAPKYAERRERLDQQFEGRQQAMQETSDQALAGASVGQDDANAANSAEANPVLWFGLAIVAGGAVLTGFAVYVFRGGHLQPTQRIALPPADSEKETDSAGETADKANKPASQSTAGH